MHDLAIPEIDDADAVVAELGDEQPLTRNVDRHMIDPAGDAAQRDLALELQQRLRLCDRDARREEHRSRQDRRDRAGYEVFDHYFRFDMTLFAGEVPDGLKESVGALAIVVDQAARL
jgi:hypothetical protein